MKSGVLVIQPNALFNPSLGEPKVEFQVPTHLLLLGSYFRTKCNLPFQILDLRYQSLNVESLTQFPVYLDQLRKILGAFQAGFRYFGISIYGSQDFIAGITIAKILKELDEQNIVIVGGFHPSFCPTDFFFPHSPIDIILKGEADIAFTETILKFELGQIARPQIAEQPRIITSSPIISLDSLPDIDWTLFNLPQYPKQARFIVPYYASRGCAFSCEYCSKLSNTIENPAERWHPVSVTKAMREIKNALRYFEGTHFDFYFYDPIFGLDLRWRSAMIDQLLAERVSCPLWLEMRIDTLRDEDIQKLAKLNTVVSLGLESGSPRMLEIMNKTPNPERYLARTQKIVASFEKYRCYWKVNALVGHPGETILTLNESFKFYDRLFSDSHYGYLFLNPFIFYPGAPIFHKQRHYSATYGTRFLHPNWYQIPINQNLVNYVHPSQDLTFQWMMTQILEFAGPFMERIAANFDSTRPMVKQALDTFASISTLRNNPTLKQWVIRSHLPTRTELDQLSTRFWQMFHEPECPTIH